MEVISLYKKEEKNSKAIQIDQGFFMENKGLFGDINGKGGDRQVSILTVNHRDAIEKEDKGLCTERFYENITIEGLDVDKLHIGQKIIIGETIQVITAIGKKCFKECNLVKSNKQCLLSTNVIFTKVVRSGNIKIGDKINRLL
jgi:MOSC domain-containing protein YiiM